jgi:hypothetical protein
MPDRSRAMTQTKRDTLVLQVGVWAWGLQQHTVKTICSKTQQSASEIEKQIWRKEAFKSDLIMANWNVRTILMPGKMQEISNEEKEDTV